MIFSNRYPRWNFPPSKRHGVILLGESGADVVSYGVVGANKSILPIVRFSGYEDGADSRALRRLGTAMQMVINHAARSCRLPVNHSGKRFPPIVTEDFESGMKIHRAKFFIFANVPLAKQKYIYVVVQNGGVNAIIPPLTFYDVPTMAQFETAAFYAADWSDAWKPKK